MQFFIYIIDFDALQLFFSSFCSLVLLCVLASVGILQPSNGFGFVSNKKYFDLVSLIADFSVHRAVRSDFHSTHKNI